MIPTDFGAEGGAEVRNKATVSVKHACMYASVPCACMYAFATSVLTCMHACTHADLSLSQLLPALDTALGVSHPPALEYIVALPFASLSLFGWGLGYNAYGHSVVR